MVWRVVKPGRQGLIRDGFVKGRLSSMVGAYGSTKLGEQSMSAVQRSCWVC